MEHKGTIRIETDRLVLKRHVLDDAEIMFKNWVTEKDNVESESYSEEDIKAAIDTIKKEFKSDWKGCTLTEIYYAGDDCTKDHKDWADRNNADAYILDGHEKFNNTDLPKDVQDFLEEIYNDEDLKDAFFDCDIEIYDEAWVKDLEEDDSWFEDLMGSGESSYKNIKPFARDGLGGLWVVLDDEMIGYIGTEGECGIIARNINEFMNIVAVQRGYIDDFCNADILKSVDAFIEEYEEPRDSDYNREFNRFIKKHGFTKDLKKIYEYIIKGVTIKPFF